MIEACEDEVEHLSWRLHVLGVGVMLEEPGTSGFGDVGKQVMLDTDHLHVYGIPSEAFLM